MQSGPVRRLFIARYVLKYKADKHQNERCPTKITNPLKVLTGINQNPIATIPKRTFVIFCNTGRFSMSRGEV